MLLDDVRKKFTDAGHRISPRDDVSEASAAWFLDVTPKTLRNWRWKKTAPVFIRLGRSARYPVIGLVEFLERKIQLAA